MSEKQASDEFRNEDEFFEICIKGHLDDRWGDWLGGLTVTLEADGTTLLTGRLIDQAALYSLLKKVRDLGMSLVSINPVGSQHSTIPPFNDFGLQVLRENEPSEVNQDKG